MKFRTPTFQTSRDPNDEGFKPGAFRVSTLPILRERKSKPNLNTDIAIDTDGPQSATSEPLLTNPPTLKKKRSRPSLGNRGGAGNEAARENVPSLPSMPIQYLKRKLSRPNLNNGASSESSGDAPEVPAVPTTLPNRSQSKPATEDAEWTPGDDGRIISKKEVLKDLLTRTGTTMKMRTAKLDTGLSEKRPKVTPERTSPIQRRAVNGSTTERPRTAGGTQSAKPFDARRNSARQSGRKFSVDIPAMPSESPADLAKKLLSVEQVRAMCIGAPCFSVEECNGRYKPQVIFRGSNTETSAEFPKDYLSFEHPSFAVCTLQSQEQKDILEDLVSNDEDSDGNKPFADLMEVPGMLGSHGIDPGSVGFEYFLQLPIADDLFRLGDSDVSDKRDLLSSAPGELGLRALNIEVLIYRLTELSQLYTQIKNESNESSEAWNQTKIEEMGAELFGKLLSSDHGATSARKGSVDMASQIRDLQKVLRTSGLWRDFGLAEWRTKLGQLLWGAESTKEDDGIPCERDILILQITLAAELLVRLNVVDLMAGNSPILSTREIGRLEKQRTTKVKWDLLLAQRFIENIDISAKMTTESGHEVNRSSLISAIPFLTAGGAPDDGVQALQPLLTPKHSEQQLEGLRYFSRALEWPDIDDLPTGTDDYQGSNGDERPSFSRVPSTYMTPISTPRLSCARISRNSSFGLVGLEEEQPALSKTSLADIVQLIPASGDDMKNVNFEGCGWLSRSWLSGLVMPGEAASAFLISTLLENSPRAMATLGGESNPYGGFVYQGRSYWNKACVVGRVMAAKKGATECMDWISVPAISEAQEDGWVNLAIKEMPDSKSKPRITEPEAVARDSDLLHNKGLLGTARVGDFTWPTDDAPIIGNEVICQGLSFNNSVKLPPFGGETSPSTRSMATLTFGSMIKRKLTVVEIPLIFDACFISSYPCHPKGAKATLSASAPAPAPKPSLKPPALSPFPIASMENKENKDPSASSGETLQRPKTAPSPVDSGYGSKSTSASTISFNAFKEELDAAKSSATTPIHPLHVDYHYDIVPVTTLFTAATETRPRALSSGVERLQPELQAASKEVMVLDCRGADDLELFARAWCAKVGENAIIGKSGRTCLACCVREARALGVCVVIRT